MAYTVIQNLHIHVHSYIVITCMYDGASSFAAMFMLGGIISAIQVHCSTSYLFVIMMTCYHIASTYNAA